MTALKKSVRSHNLCRKHQSMGPSHYSGSDGEVACHSWSSVVNWLLLITHKLANATEWLRRLSKIGTKCMINKLGISFKSSASELQRLQRSRSVRGINLQQGHNQGLEGL